MIRKHYLTAYERVVLGRRVLRRYSKIQYLHCDDQVKTDNVKEPVKEDTTPKTTIPVAVSSDPVQQHSSINSINDGRAIIAKSEMDYISMCIRDYPRIETGGQLFGYWTEAGVPVVMYALGPGRNANHQNTFFNQDLGYLQKVGSILFKKYKLHHIGEWHSHHQLGLAKPSGHDAHTMCSTIREKNLGRFMLCIGNCQQTASGVATTLNPFLCDDTNCYKCTWDIINAGNTIRQQIDQDIKDILVHPRTSTPLYVDSSLNPKSSVATFQKGYWLNEKGSGAVLKNIQSLVMGTRGGGGCSKVKLDDKGHVHLVTEWRHGWGTSFVEDIEFPRSFPYEAPVIIRNYNGHQDVITDSGIWEYFDGDIFTSFKNYYKNIA